MKYTKHLAVLAVFSLVMSVGLFAESKSAGKMSITDPVQVGSTRLAPGDYKVEWTGTGDNVQINIMKGNKVVASTEGKVVEMPNSATSNAVVTKELDNNTRALTEIQFDNRKEALQLANSQVAEK